VRRGVRRLHGVRGRRVRGGDAGYALCASVSGPVALGCPLLVRGVDVLAALGNITCDNRDAYARLPCAADGDCATCDACLERTCVGGGCVSAPRAPTPVGCGVCVVDADCAPAPCVDARCRAGVCVRRILPYCAAA
jgi:hypothetical protein